MKAESEQLVLLALPPQSETVYFVLRRKNYPSAEPYTDDHRSYFFEEHSCPTNWIGDTVMIAQGGDVDPHGFLTFVRSVPAPAEVDDPQDEDAQIMALFPEVSALDAKPEDQAVIDGHEAKPAG